MRGTVLLLDRDNSLRVATDLFRQAGLVVQHCDEAAQALKHFQDSGADVIVVASTQQCRSTVRDLRHLAGDATSIVVASALANREEARGAGADSFLLNSAPPADLLYEIHRALILHRSGRRLPWNW